jgi:hypothetical protein
MFILSANGASLVDATGLEIRAIDQQRQMEDGSIQIETVGYEIIGFGIGFSVSLGQYAMEQQARDIFNDMLAGIKKNKDFYDVRENELKFRERWG